MPEIILVYSFRLFSLSILFFLNCCSIRFIVIVLSLKLYSFHKIFLDNNKVDQIFTSITFNVASSPLCVRCSFRSHGTFHFRLFPPSPHVCVPPLPLKNCSMPILAHTL